MPAAVVFSKILGSDMASNSSRIYLNKVSLLFLAADTLTISAVYILCVCFFNPSVFEAHTKAFFFLFIVLLTVWMWSETSYKLYVEDRIKSTLLFSFSKLFEGVMFMEVATVLVVYLRNKPFLSNHFIVAFPLALLTCLLVERVVITKFVLYLRKRGFNIRHIVLLGGGEKAAHFYKLVNDNLYLGYNMLGYFDDKPQADISLKYLGEEGDLEQFLNANYVNEIIITYPEINTSEIAAVMYAANREGIRVRIIPDIHFMYNRKYEFWQMGNISTFTLRSEPLESLYNKIIKRVFDVLFSLLVLVLILSWLIPLIALLIKLDSKGSVFFIQNRLGRDLKQIKVFKFRTMKVMETDNQYQQATKDDPRITRLGSVLRKTSLDEIPQFLNVLIGNMSVVGPRPHPLKMNDDYKKSIDNYMVRHLLKPGITGWAQVNGYRGEIESKKDMIKRIEADIWYLENWSFYLDIKIILLTVLNVIRGEEKAY